MRDDEAVRWFGAEAPIGEMSLTDAVGQLRAIDDQTSADELSSSLGSGTGDSFAVADLVQSLFTRYVKTTHVCGFLPATGADTIVPVTSVAGQERLRGRPLTVTLDGLHVARYPGRGRHSILFDFGLQGHARDDLKEQVLHFNARFEAGDGETVPVHNFPLFLGVSPGPDGITLGFQTVNVSSSLDAGLLDFLDSDAFKTGLSLVSATPVLAQISGMATALTRWLAGQSKNVKVQEFRQGLDFASGRLGGGLAAGTYVVAQIPLEHQREWNWADWTVDPTLVRLVARGATQPANDTLEFNHVMIGVRPLD
jgi:hypothetical protein